MGICMSDVYARERREAAHTAFVSAPNYPALEQAARQRGFRKATIGEIHASAERASFACDLYSWRGGLWVRA